MMDAYDLPTSLCIGGGYYAIRTDFRDIIKIIKLYNDEEFDNNVKTIVMMRILFKNPEEIPEKNIREAVEKACLFIDGGEEMREKAKPYKLMDWDKDGRIIMSAVNKSAGHDIRSDAYIHWWTFLSYYTEIGESTFANVVHIRSKRAKGEKLQDWERQYYKENKEMIDIDQQAKRSQEEIDILRDLFGLNK